MADQRTMVELLRASTKGYAEAIIVPPIPAEHFELKHSLINLVTSKQSFDFEKEDPHAYIRYINKITSTLTYKDIATAVASVVTSMMTAMLKQHQVTPASASVKAIEESCVTCGGYNQDRGNYQGNTSYQVPIQTPQVATSSDLEKLKKMNEVNIKAMQTQINNVKNELRNEMQSSIQASMSNQTNELKNMMASFFQMNIPSILGSGSLPSNAVVNPKGELKAITTRSGLILDGPSVPMPPPFINLEEDEREEETITNPEHGEFIIKVPPLPVQKAKPPSQRNFMVHKRDPRHPHIPYPFRMNQEKQKEKDEVQIHKIWKMFKQLHVNISLADALILIPKYQKMIKSLLSNKEKLLEMTNTPLSENCSAIILKKLPEKLGDPGKFLIPYGFSELKCKALADLCASINLMPLSICTPVGIARGVFVPVGKFTFPTNFIIVDYESDPSVPLILGRPFLQTARALIDVHGEEMILCDGDERLILNMRHDTSSYSNNPQKESINMIDIYNISYEDYLEDLFANKKITNHLSGNPTFSSEPNSDLTSSEVKDDIFDPEGEIFLIEKLLNLDSTKDLPPSPLSGSTTSSSSLTASKNRNDDMTLEDVIKEVDCLLNQSLLANYSPSNDLMDTTPEMFTDEHTLDYSSPPLWDDDNLFDLEPDNDNVYDDPFDFKEEKIKESKLLIDELNELDPPRSSDFLPSSESDLVFYEDFFKVDALPSTNNEDKVFNPGIFIHENLYEVTNYATSKKNVKKISYASLILEDFNPSLYELPFQKEVSGLGFTLDFPDCEASRARGFVLRSLELQILSFILGI
ncbi:reverse transcriptase domain-containing protein [Tanacetum coccineum]